MVRYSRYSPYLVELRRSYLASQFLDVYREFISEKQIGQGKLTQYKILVIPGVSHMREAVFKKILSFDYQGGVVLLSPQSLIYDEYHRESDYLVRLGVGVRKMDNPPPVRVKGLLEGYQVFLQKYFEAAGLLNRDNR